MKHIFTGLVLLFLTSVFVNADDGTSKIIELKLQPAAAPEPNDKYRLLLKPEEQNDSDALPLYEKAIQIFPEDFQKDRIKDWLKSPLNELPSEQVESVLQRFKPSMQLVEQAAKCKNCFWPFEVEVDPDILNKYKILASALALKAHLFIVQGHYDNAVDTIRIALSMARHLANSSSMQKNLTGIAVGALICNQLEQLIQSQDAPNLYWAFQSLPRPFIDLTDQIN